MWSANWADKQGVRFCKGRKNMHERFKVIIVKNPSTIFCKNHGKKHWKEEKKQCNRLAGATYVKTSTQRKTQYTE